MTSDLTARSLAVRLDVPDALRPAYRYALTELLFGLGLVPVEAAPPALVVGPDALPSAAHLPADPAAAVLAGDPRTSPLDPARGGWMDATAPDGAAMRLPLAFGSPEAPDLVATAFAWLAGWGEASAERDGHGRVPFAASWAHTLGLPTDLPVVDALRVVLADRLRAAGIDVPGRTWGGDAGALALTCDVDALYRVRPGIFKQVFWDDLARNAKREPFATRLHRADRLLGDAMRPGDPYLFDLAWLADTFAPLGGGTFFLKADATNRAYDTPVNLADEALGAVAAMGHEVALHPSYDGGGRLDHERAALRSAFPDASDAVRSHYLRFDPLETPGRLEAAGVALDSSLGWSDTTGFRRGTTHPFRLYDLATGRTTNVWELPLALMDVALFVREAATHEAGQAVTERLLDTARRFGGVVVALWHNTLSLPDVNPASRAHVLETVAAAQVRGLRTGGVSELLETWKRG